MEWIFIWLVPFNHAKACDHIILFHNYHLNTYASKGLNFISLNCFAITLLKVNLILLLREARLCCHFGDTWRIKGVVNLKLSWSELWSKSCLARKYNTQLWDDVISQTRDIVYVTRRMLLIYQRVPSHFDYLT